MLKHELLADKGILVVRPEAPLAASDFATLTAEADAYIAAHGSLNGLMICAATFPGWENVDGAIAHFKFVRDHQRKIAKVAMVSDSDLLTVLPALANHFVSAEVKHFAAADEEKALKWLSG